MTVPSIAFQVLASKGQLFRVESSTTAWITLSREQFTGGQFNTT